MVKFRQGLLFSVIKILQKGCIWLAGAQNLQTATYPYFIFYFYLFIYFLTLCKYNQLKTVEKSPEACIEEWIQLLIFCIKRCFWHLVRILPGAFLCTPNWEVTLEYTQNSPYTWYFCLAWECLRIPQGELESTDEGGRHLGYTAWPAALMTKLPITIRQWRDYIKYYPWIISINRGEPALLYIISNLYKSLVISVNAPKWNIFMFRW